MNRIVVDLQTSLGALQLPSISVPLSRIMEADDVAILRLFDMRFRSIRPSSAQYAESKRLDELSRKMEQNCNHVSF